MVLEQLNQGDLATVCRVGKYVRSIAEPCLYTHIELEQEGVGRSIAPLISTFLRRPKLAEHTRSLSIGAHNGCGPTWANRELPSETPTIGDVCKTRTDEFVACVNAMHVDFEHLWIQNLTKGALDAFISLLVSRLPNLQWLDLYDGAAKQTVVLGKMFSSALCSPRGHENSSFPKFHQLRDVYLQPGLPTGPDDYGNTADILSLLYLPALRTLAAKLDNPLFFRWPCDTMPECHNLTSLDLDGVREGMLGRLLSRTKNLRTLHWEWTYDPNVYELDPTMGGNLAIQLSHHSAPIINLGQIVTDLSNVQTTLKSLSVTAECEWRWDGVYPWLGVQGSLKLLATFECLTELQIPLVFLVGFFRNSQRQLGQYIPKSVELLILNNSLCYDQCTWTTASVCRLIQTWLKKGRVPTSKLRQITLVDTIYATAEVPIDQVRNLKLLTKMCKIGMSVGLSMVALHSSQMDYATDLEGEGFVGEIAGLYLGCGFVYNGCIPSLEDSNLQDENSEDDDLEDEDKTL